MIDALSTIDEVIATQRRYYENMLLVSNKNPLTLSADFLITINY